MTSAISPPRRLLADCSPSTQRTASTTFDLPLPLGPTTAVTPGGNSKTVLSAKLLKPTNSRRLSMTAPKELSPRKTRNRRNKEKLVILCFAYFVSFGVILLSLLAVARLRGRRVLVERRRHADVGREQAGAVVLAAGELHAGPGQVVDRRRLRQRVRLHDTVQPAAGL